MNFILVLISLIPIAILLKIVYSSDKVEKEPIKLLLLLFVGGFISLFLSKFLASKYQNFIPFLIEHNFELDKYKVFLVSFGEIGLIEELSKFLILVIMIFKNKNFNYIYDAIVYSSFVSLGFATLENILYFSSMNILSIFLRVIITNLAHLSFGIIMGYYLGFWKYYSNKGAKYNSFRMFYSALFFPVICLLRDRILTNEAWNVQSGNRFPFQANGRKYQPA